MNRKKRKQKRILSVLIFIIGLLLAGYIGGWLLFIKPIIACCAAFDAGNLTALMVGISIIKIVFATAISSIIFWVASMISILISGDEL